MNTRIEIQGYELQSELGAGGMGTVYLAIKRRTRQQVAIKIISDSNVSDTEMLQRFAREAKALKLLSHPNIVRFIDFRPNAARPHIVMEYVAGETLAERLIRTGAFSIPATLHIATQASAALTHAANVGIVHRDVKPSNFILSGNQLKLSDFGIARQIAVDRTLTRTGMLIGTPRYMAPEQFSSASPTRESDVYSLGIVFFEILAGYPPFQASDILQVYQCHLTEPLPIHELPSSAPSILIDLLLRMTAKKASARPTYEEVNKALIALSGTAGGETRPAVTMIAPPVVESATEVVRSRFGALRGQCFCCDKPTNTFSLDHRFCDSPKCEAQNFLRKHPRDLDVYVTILPDRAEPYPDANLPTFGQASSFLARAHDDVGRASPTVKGTVPFDRFLPYASDHLASLGLHLGNPVVYRVPGARRWAAFEEIYVLDMSTYGGSHTLKDPKSWAVLNCALESGITHLALYTAGNAGVSLGQMVYEVNKRRPGGPKIQVHALADPKMTQEMRAILAAWGCEVLDIDDDGSHILHPRNIWTRIFPDYSEQGTPAGAWHVTDGWDGVGITMYRLLLAQVMRQLQVDYVVAPLGTGSLFLGTYLGIRDAARDSRPTLVGAVPAGQNILKVCGISPPSDKGQANALYAMPKLGGHYTPLAPCIASLADDEKVKFVPVSVPMLRAAAKAVLPTVAAEPSALAGFAALHGLEGIAGVLEFAQQKEDPTFPAHARIYESPSKVLVVSSGLGLLSESEAALLSPPAVMGT